MSINEGTHARQIKSFMTKAKKLVNEANDLGLPMMMVVVPDFRKLEKFGPQFMRDAVNDNAIYSDSNFRAYVPKGNTLPDSDKPVEAMSCLDLRQHVQNIVKYALGSRPGFGNMEKVPYWWPESVCWKTKRPTKSCTKQGLKVMNKSDLLNIVVAWNSKNSIRTTSNVVPQVPMQPGNTENVLEVATEDDLENTDPGSNYQNENIMGQSDEIQPLNTCLMNMPTRMLKFQSIVVSLYMYNHGQAFRQKSKIRQCVDLTMKFKYFLLIFLDLVFCLRKSQLYTQQVFITDLQHLLSLTQAL